VQIRGLRDKLLEGVLADIVASKFCFSMATACVEIVRRMESEGLLAAVPQGKHCPVLCVGTLIVVSRWGAALGFEKLKAAIFDSTDVSYVQPPSPPPTTGAGASTTGIMPHAHAAACCWFPGCICRLHYVIPWLICAGCLAQVPRRLTIALLPHRMLRAIHQTERLGAQA
jgi:hypothetical protein